MTYQDAPNKEPRDGCKPLDPDIRKRLDELDAFCRDCMDIIMTLVTTQNAAEYSTRIENTMRGMTTSLDGLRQLRVGY